MRTVLLMIAAAVAVMAALAIFAGLAVGWAVAGAGALALAAFAANAQTGARISSQPAAEAPPSPEIAQRETLRLIADALPDPVLLLDKAGNVIAANQPARLVFERIDLEAHISSVIRTRASSKPLITPLSPAKA